MKKSIFLLLSLLHFCLASSTKEETKLLVEQTVNFCKTHTQKECFKAINSDRFIQNELFIFAFDYNGVGVANGKIKQLIGKKLWYLRNQDDMYVFQEQIRTAKNGAGWLRYKWKTPKGQDIMKLSYISDINGNFYVGSGLTLVNLEDN
jgi:signal transduction histidine kinase